MRILSIVLALSVAISWHAVPAFAQSQMELNAQAGREREMADKELNAVYSRLMAKLPNESRERLRKAELTWLRFLEEECAFETDGTTGGSIHGMLVAYCQARLIRQRTKDLEEQLNCKEGDLSCVH
ncbi:lysozyme inhibitor LprI family protein [Enhydrobacter aerosaccus]|uniref:lysozyme inhibitor LprI family protein n=1 Tax=Enhydrobacter aerosaccus TaxID=225324 RepID=UPI001481D615|nr:lysozyme inhibitor LprI family protein [Enhydrobacter aerosaccus]